MPKTSDFVVYLLELFKPLRGVSAKQAPPECLDQSETLCDWSQKSYEAALRKKP